MNHFRKNLPLVLVILTIVGHPTSSTNNGTVPEWMGHDAENATALGALCEVDHDRIGLILGCSCVYPPSSPGTDLIANCQSQNLGTNITLLPNNLNISRHVRTLNFAENQFTVLDGEWFGNVEGVTELIFSFNMIHTVKPLDFRRLSKLDLSHNVIANLTDEVFKNCPKLQQIDLSSNQLKFIESDVFIKLPFLRRLNLASNEIGLGAEYYDEFPFLLTNLDRLEELNLNDNSLEDFPTKKIFVNTTNIKRLYMKHNKILFMPLEADFPKELANLEELDISGNFFTMITANTFFEFKGLRKLILDGNRNLTMIDEYAFSGLFKLRELSCQRNHRLTFIHPAAFQADPLLPDALSSSPKIVRLGENALQFFGFPLLDWKNMEELDLYRNPWNCDCNLQWVAHYRARKTAEASILIDNDFLCFNPPPFRGEPVALLDPSEMLCFSEAASILGLIGLIIFGAVLIAFFLIVGLGAIGSLPHSLKRLNIFGRGSNLPKYSRVYPKPSTGRSHPSGVGNEGGDEFEMG